MRQSNRQAKPAGVFKSAARAAQMGKSKPQFSDNFLAEYKEEAKRRSCKGSSEELYHCQCKSLADWQKKKCLSVCKSLH